MSGRRITRARLLAAALAAATPLALAGLEPWRRLVEIERRTPARRLAALLRDRKAAGAIGAAYLRARPRERTVAGLVRALARGLPAAAARSRPPPTRSCEPSSPPGRPTTSRRAAR